MCSTVKRVLKGLNGNWDRPDFGVGKKDLRKSLGLGLTVVYVKPKGLQGMCNYYNKLSNSKFSKGRSPKSPNESGATTLPYLPPILSYAPFTSILFIDAYYNTFSFYFKLWRTQVMQIKLLLLLLVL